MARKLTLVLRAPRCAQGGQHLVTSGQSCFGEFEGGIGKGFERSRRRLAQGPAGQQADWLDAARFRVKHIIAGHLFSHQGKNTFDLELPLVGH